MQDKHVFAALDTKFETTPTSVSVPQIATPPVPKKDKQEDMIDDDFEQARTALKDMVHKGQLAVDNIMDIARQSDHPRAFEVTGQLIKTVAETAKDLLDLQKQKKALSAPVAGDVPKQIGTQNNIVFSGNTNGLLKLLRKQDEKVIDGQSTDTTDQE